MSNLHSFLILKTSASLHVLLLLLLHAATLEHIDFVYVIRVVAFKTVGLYVGHVHVVVVRALHLRPMHQTLLTSVAIQYLTVDFVVAGMIFIDVVIVNLWKLQGWLRLIPHHSLRYILPSQMTLISLLERLPLIVHDTVAVQFFF